MIKKLVYTVALAFILSSCSLYHIDSEDNAMDYYPAKASADDVAYVETVDKPHEVIGSITVNAERRQKISEIILKMKREAAILGGDAITEIQTDSTGSWKKLPAHKVTGNGYIRANFTAQVIVFK